MREEAIDMTEMRKTPHKRPLQHHRHCTDIVFIGIFLLILAVWIWLLSSDAKSKDKKPIEPALYYIIDYFEPLLGQFSSRNTDLTFYKYISEKPTTFGLFIWYTIFGGFVMFISLMTVRLLPKICHTAIAIVFCFFVVLQLIIEFIVLCARMIEALNSRSDESISSTSFVVPVVIIIIYLIFILPIILCAVRQKVNATAVLQKSLQAAFFFPSLIIMGIILILPQVVIRVYVIICFDKGLSKDYSSFKIILISLGGFYLTSFFYYFGKMVIFEAITIWHKKEEKRFFRCSCTILHCIGRVLRYHLGTVAFAATIILPFFVAIYVAIVSRYYGFQQCCYRFIQVLCKIFLVFKTPDIALVETAIHGHNYLQATKRTFHVMVKYSPLSLTFVMFLNVLLTIAMVLAYWFCILSYDLYFRVDIDKTYYLEGIVEIEKKWAGLIMLFFFPLTLVTEASAYAMLINTLEDKEEDEKSRGGLDTQL